MSLAEGVADLVRRLRLCYPVVATSVSETESRIASELSALLAQHAQPCPDCEKAAKYAYSDATTPGFFHDKCERHRHAQPEAPVGLTDLETVARDVVALAERGVWSGRRSTVEMAKAALLTSPVAPPPQTLGQRMGNGAPAILLQKIEAILGRCVFDQPDSLSYDEGVKLVWELVATAHAAKQPKLTVDGMYWIAFGKFLTARFGGELPADNEHGRFWEAASNLLALVAPPPPLGTCDLVSQPHPQECCGEGWKPLPPLAPGEQPPLNLTLLESQAQSILTNCCQLLDSVKSEWAPENCWSDWDQSVRDAASAWLKDSYDLIAAPVTGYHCGACGAELGDSVKRVAPVADGSSPSKAPLPAPPVQEQASDEGPNCGCSEAPECTHTLYWWMGYKAGEVFAAKLAREEALEEIINLLPGKPREIGSAQLHAGYYAGLEAYRQAIRALAAQPAPQKEGVK